MRRREFIKLVSVAAVSPPFGASAQNGDRAICDYSP